MKQKLILIDVDGVTLQYNEPFQQFMNEKGYQASSLNDYDYCKIYNKPFDEILKLCEQFTHGRSDLKPITGATYYINKLHKDYGYKFHFITSISNHPETVKARICNLKTYIQDSAIYDVTCLGTFECKYDYLKEHYVNSGLWWIEDSVTNYKDGIRLGLRSLLLDQPYNRDYNTPNRVQSWDEIYERITSI